MCGYDICVFSSYWEHYISARLLSILLIRAGVETNPGPEVWICSVCNQRIGSNAKSVQCNCCLEWVHFRCSGLRRQGQHSLAYVAAGCINSGEPRAAPSPPSPPLPPTPPNNMIRSARPSLTRGPPPPAVFTALSILQFNCNGIHRKIAEITHFLSSNRILIAAIQETLLHANSSLSVHSEYVILRKDRPAATDDSHPGGGLAFLIHKSVHYCVLDVVADGTAEIQAISVPSGSTNIEIFNIYVPPHSSCPSGYRFDIGPLLSGEHRVILGDFNAHHELWHSDLNNNARGITIAESLDASEFCSLNEGSPTGALAVVLLT